MFKPASKMRTVKMSSEYYYAEFKLLEPFKTPLLPLQFVNIWIPGVDEVPMSISTVNDDEIGILFRIVGDGTRSLRDKQGFFGIKGPLGRGLDVSTYDRVLFIAGGIGIAPLPYLSNYASLRGVRVDVAWGVRTSDMLFDLRKLALNLGDVYIATEDCNFGFCGDIVELTKKLITTSTVKWDILIAVGPVQMLKSICDEVGSNQEVRISLEALVKCGLGVCGSCTLKPYPLILCIDGPVFKCQEVYRYLENYSKY